MQLIINVSTNNPELILKQNKKILSRHSWQGHLDLAEKLLPELDRFLKKQGLKLHDLKKITSRSNPKSMMSSNIASIVAQILQWAKNSTRS